MKSTNGKKWKLIGLLIVLLMAFVLSGCLKDNKQEKIMSIEVLGPLKAVLIIARQGFQDFEYNETKRVLEEAGVEVSTASLDKGLAVGKLGQKVEVEMSLNEINLEDFDAVIFIGGPGAADYEDDPLAHKLAQQTMEQGRVLGAICIAPTILAKAGILEGRKATVWSDPIVQETIEILREQGADYVDEAVVVDGKLITANGPGAAAEFGQKIVETLNK